MWALLPPLSPHKLAKTGHFVSVGGIDTYYERYGSGPPLILIPAGASHTSAWRFNINNVNFFLRTTKNRLTDPSEIFALDFNGKFRRFKIPSVSATVGIDWSIFDVL